LQHNIKEYEKQHISLNTQIWKRYILYLELTHWIFIFEKIEHISINRKYSYPILSTYDIRRFICVRLASPQNESSLKIRARADLHVCPLLSPRVLASLFSLFSLFLFSFTFLADTRQMPSLNSAIGKRDPAWPTTRSYNFKQRKRDRYGATKIELSARRDIRVRCGMHPWM